METPRDSLWMDDEGRIKALVEFLMAAMTLQAALGAPRPRVRGSLEDRLSRWRRLEASRSWKPAECRNQAPGPKGSRQSSGLAAAHAAKPAMRRRILNYSVSNSSGFFVLNQPPALSSISCLLDAFARTLTASWRLNTRRQFVEPRQPIQ